MRGRPEPLGPGRGGGFRPSFGGSEPPWGRPSGWPLGGGGSPLLKRLWSPRSSGQVTGLEGGFTKIRLLRILGPGPPKSLVSP